MAGISWTEAPVAETTGFSVATVSRCPGERAMSILIVRVLHSATRTGCVSVACLLLCLSAPLALLARSPGLAELQVSETEGVYTINLVTQMQVPAHYVYRVLTDYEHIYRLDPAIIDSEILPAPDGAVVRVRTRIKDCIAFFCRTIDRVEDVRELKYGGLQARIVAALSNFKSGHAEWKILGSQGHTRVIYHAQMEPDFYIPPLIGSYFVKQKLRKNLLASFARIECIARIQAGLEEQPGRNKAMLAKGTDDRTAGAALLAGQDPTRVAQAPAAGNPVREPGECTRPCRKQNTGC